MSAKSVKKSKVSKGSKTKHDFPEEAAEMKDTAISFLGEVEKSGEKLAIEVKHFFEQLADHVSSVASTAAKTTVSVTEKVTGADPTPHLSRMMDEVKEAGEVSLRAIGSGFDTLRSHIMTITPAVESKPAEQTARKKSTAKKATAKKATAKKATAKKATAKKTGASKKVTKKAAAPRKTGATRKVTGKAAAKKKVSARKVAKKPVAGKKTAGKKSATKKVGTKKAVKKKAVARKAVKKKAA